MSLTIPISPELEQQLHKVAEAVGISPETYIVQLIQSSLSQQSAVLSATEQLSQDEVLLDNMVKTIVDVVNPEKIILFGSRAKGTARENSDYDFLVIDAETFSAKHSRRKTAGKIWRALAPFKVSADIVMYNIEEVERWKNSQNHVISHALNEGKILYERP
ncbi:MAG: nucleotidyltransferase domain-containing protein [Cyanobacteria bacterium J06560_6]